MGSLGTAASNMRTHGKIVKRSADFLGQEAPGAVRAMGAAAYRDRSSSSRSTRGGGQARRSRSGIRRPRSKITHANRTEGWRLVESLRKQREAFREYLRDLRKKGRRITNTIKRNRRELVANLIQKRRDFRTYLQNLRKGETFSEAARRRRRAFAEQFKANRQAFRENLRLMLEQGAALVANIRFNRRQFAENIAGQRGPVQVTNYIEDVSEIERVFLG